MLSLRDLIFQDVDIDVTHSRCIFLYWLIRISISCWGHRANQKTNGTEVKSILDKSREGFQSDEAKHH